MNRILVLLSLLASVASAATQISGVSVSQDPDTRLVTISYQLTGDDAIVTLSLKTNGVAIPGTALKTLNGEVAMKLSEGAKTACWLPDETDIDRVVAAGGFEAELSVWATNAPPPYMTADIVATNVIRFYESEARLPGGIGDAIYRTDKLLMRLVPAKNVVWRMGAEGDESGQGKTSTDYYLAEIPHYVKLTNDFYIGVFPVTQGQAFLIAGLQSTLTKTLSLLDSNWEGVPANNVSWNTLRGTDYAWPGDLHNVTKTSPIGVMRAVTGLEIDLPTEAQWEYACRAGTGAQLNNGKTATAANAAEIAWTRDNAYLIANETGQLKPNGFGLYDMHGSVFEWCLDWLSTGDAYLATFGAGFDTSTDVLVEPVGPSTGNNRIIRGGSWVHYVQTLGRCATRGYASPSTGATTHRGFRVCCPAEF